MALPPHHCRGCPARWGGSNTAHCSVCHLTFSGVTTFDEHQKHSRCLSVAELFLLKRGGMHEVRPGVFGRPSAAQTPTAR